MLLSLSSRSAFLNLVKHDNVAELVILGYNADLHVTIVSPMVVAIVLLHRLAWINFSLNSSLEILAKPKHLVYSVVPTE